MRFLIVLFVFLSAPAFACGTQSDCEIGDRHYRIVMPEGYDGSTPVGVLVWAHGYKGSAAGVMRNKALLQVVSDAGFALIAAQGVDGSWELPNGPGTFDSTGAAEFAYFDAVLADASARYAIDLDRVVASGFSAGGMMVWNLACNRPGTFAGFIPFSGTFWLEPPFACDAPATSVVHIHGDADKVVPLTGRAIRETKQGDVVQAMEMYARFGGFSEIGAQDDLNLSCTTRANPENEILVFCLFPGGHSFSTKHLAFGIELLQQAGKM